MRRAEQQAEIALAVHTPHRPWSEHPWSPPVSRDGSTALSKQEVLRSGIMRLWIIVYERASLLLLGLCGLSLGAGSGWLLALLIFGATRHVFWVVSGEELVLISVGVAVGGGLSIYTA